MFERFKRCQVSLSLASVTTTVNTADLNPIFQVANTMQCVWRMAALLCSLYLSSSKHHVICMANDCHDLTMLLHVRVLYPAVEDKLQDNVPSTIEKLKQGKGTHI